MVVLKVRRARNIWENTKGLIGAKSAYPLFLTTRFGIHTFFLKFSIDVIVLDDATTIKVCKINLRPNRIFFWNPLYKNVIELPAGMIKEKKLRIGERIVIAE